MFKKQMKVGFMFFTALFFVVLSGLTAQAVAAETLEVGEVRSLGDKVKVPVTIRDTQYIKSGQVKITFPSTSKGVVLQKFEPTSAFDGDLFRTETHIEGDSLKVDFISQTDKEQRLTDKMAVIGYITYGLSKDFTEGSTVSLNIDSIVAQGRNSADLTLEPLGGKIERKMPFGDVVGNDEPNAAGAMRILQHINGNALTDREAFLSADVDGDGILTQNDAQHILDYVTGKRTSFLAIKAKELDSAVLKSEYMEQVEGLHGREPYAFKRQGGSLPSGVKVDPATGELTGIPSRAGNYKFTIRVTDAVGNTADREFTLDVIDSNIASVEKLLPINVQLNGVPALPTEVTATYKDKTQGKEKVVWDKVDTSVIGTTIVKGKIGDSGFTVSVEIHVVNENYIDGIRVSYFEFLNLHTIVMDVSSDVYKVTINGISTHYEGSNQFSLGSSSFTKGSSVTIVLYDKYGNVLETKSHKLTPN